MSSNLFTFREQERARLQMLPVAALILFGSRAQGIARSESDYDIGVLVSEQRVLRDRTERRTLYDALYDVLSAHLNTLTDIDIVFLEEAPAELKAHTVKYGKSIYAASEAAFARFKEREMLAYADFAPLRRIFQDAILARVA